MAKETYSYGKKDLFIWQKRPIHMAKKNGGEREPVQHIEYILRVVPGNTTPTTTAR